MIISGREIKTGSPPYIVAEASCNHSGKLKSALRLIEVAKQSGADAIKFQCYTADTITLNAQNNPEFIIKGGPWHGKHLHDLYSQTETPFSWFPELFESARQRGITLFCSVFDKTSVDFLEKLGCPAYKIASMECIDTPLIKYAAQTGKPIIISTGMANNEEIQTALNALNRHRGGTALLSCISGYPTRIEESNLSNLDNLKRWPNCKIGISDHTLGWDIPVAATVLGAQIIEKHLMLHDFEYARELPEDSTFSMYPSGFQEMCIRVRTIWKALQPSVAASQETSKQLRRSLYVVKPVKKGEIFTEDNIRSIRPCYGLPPNQLPHVLGSKATQDIEAGTALAWRLVDRIS